MEAQKMPTMAEIMKRVVDVKEIHDVNVSFGTSRQVWQHGEVCVSGYWICEGVGACVLYTTPRRVWAYYIQTSPFTQYGQNCTYEINEEEAEKFIKERGGIFAEGFSLSEEIKKRYGGLVASVNLSEHNKWNDVDVTSYKIYKNGNGILVFLHQNKWKGRKLQVGELSDFYRKYMKSYKGDEWKKHKKELLENDSVCERDIDIQKDVLNSLANMALLNDV